MANPYAGKASSDSPALKPYRGKPAVRNFRGGDGNVGIIRSPVRAIALPDRVFSNLAEGWKPVMIESSMREVGVRETHVMSAARHQLVMAENMMFQIANELFIEDAFAHGLWNRDPETLSIWRAIGRYNRFFRDNEDYYVDVRSTATLAIILDNRIEGIGLLNELSARNVIDDVLCEHELTPELLKHYSAVALLTVQTVRDRALSSLRTYVRGGGTLFAVADAARLNERGRARAQVPFFKTETTPTCIYREKVPPLDELAAMLKHLGRPRPVRVEAPQGVLYNAVVQPKTGRMIVHLLNYTPQPADKISVSVEGRYAGVKLLSPDGVRERVRILTSTGASTELEVPQLSIYSLIVLEPRGSLNSHED